MLADATDATDADTTANAVSAPTVDEQPDAEDGWQQRGLCDCAVCLCQNERSDKSSDRELPLFQIYKRNTTYASSLPLLALI